MMQVMKVVILGNLTLASPVMNAAGPWAASASQLQVLHASAAGAVVTKSFSLEPSDGNKSPNQYFSTDFSINSVGLKNKGADYFIAASLAIKKRKPLIASIAENSVERFVELAVKVGQGNFDAIELNVSCPNVTTKEPLAYDPHQLDVLLRRLIAHVALPIGVKLPPYLTRGQILAVAAVLQKHAINHLVLINTYPLASAYARGQSVIAPNDGVGGLGGAYLKPIALAHVRLFKKFLPDMPVVGVGGVRTAGDVRDFLHAGAVGVQIGSALHAGGVHFFNTFD